MAEEPEEIDYLAGTKPYPRIPTFADEVRMAFRLEHQCQQDRDIAAILKVTGGRVSQILGQPRTLKAETVMKVISALSSVPLRRRVFNSWKQECFGEELGDADAGGLIGDAPTEATIKAIDRFVRTFRPDRALKATEHALTFNLDPELHRKLLDRAFYLYQRLDQMGDAIGIAYQIFEDGKAANDLQKVATGLAMKARVLRSIDGVDFKTVKGLHDDVIAILDTLPEVRRSARKHITADKRLVRTETIATVLKHHERHGGAEDFLKGSLREIQTEISAADPASESRRSFQLEARIHLALKDYFKAEDILDEMFEAGDLSLGVDATCGIIRAKIIAARGDIDEAIAYYEKLCTLCEAERHLYLHRLSQRDLAVLKATKFPPSRPV